MYRSSDSLLAPPEWGDDPAASKAPVAPPAADGPQGTWDARLGRFVKDAPPPAIVPDAPSDMIFASDKEVAAAAILSLFIPGTGQIYIGQTAKGIALLVGGFLAFGWLCGLLVPVIGVDAYMMADRLSEGKGIRPWQFFWEK